MEEEVTEMELRLLQIREAKGVALGSPDDIVQFMQEEAKADREAFWVLHLNTKNKVVEKELVALGTLDSAVIAPREVFRKAVINSASGIIGVHNHPSGDPDPSFEDLTLFDRLKEAGSILGINVLDNIILGTSGAYYSDKEKRG